jgi:transcriptional regulator with XRE-family HTH domain
VPDTRQSRKSPLRAYREEKRLTQSQVAERIAQLAWYREHAGVGVNADMVSKWERGSKAVSPLYQDLYCELFSATPEQLGFRAPNPRLVGSPLETESWGVTAVLTQLGEAAELLGPASGHLGGRAVETPHAPQTHGTAGLRGWGADRRRQGPPASWRRWPTAIRRSTTPRHRST